MTFETPWTHIFQVWKWTQNTRFCMLYVKLSIMSFPKFVTMTKNTPFFPILNVFAPLNDVCTYIAWSWKTSLITWIFFTRIISNFKCKCPPPGAWNAMSYVELQQKVIDLLAPQHQYERTLTLQWPRYFYSRWCPRGVPRDPTVENHFPTGILQWYLHHICMDYKKITILQKKLKMLYRFKMAAK